MIILRDIDQIIKEVDGSMSIEGMSLNQEDKDRIKECLVEKTTFEDMKRKIIKKHTIVV
ncbi:MAG: hypothetical protein AB2375_07635 [Tissierellaceae bacterium]